MLFSAHGVSPEIRERAEQRRLLTIDATCPLVNKVHQEVTRFSQQGYSVFLIGRSGHDEVVGTLGVAPGIQLVESEDAVDTLQAEDPVRTAYVMQTTLSVDDAKLRFSVSLSTWRNQKRSKRPRWFSQAHKRLGFFPDARESD